MALAFPVCAQKRGTLASLPPLLRMPVLEGQGPALMASSNPNALLKTLSPNMVTVGVRTSNTDRGGTRFTPQLVQGTTRRYTPCDIVLFSLAETSPVARL